MSRIQAKENHGWAQANADSEGWPLRFRSCGLPLSEWQNKDPMPGEQACIKPDAPALLWNCYGV
jgi:hypothetical protein